MAIIESLNVDATVQLIAIVLIGVTVLLIIVGIVICCCRSDTSSEPSKKLAEIQNPRNLPETGVFSILLIEVERWSQLHQCSSMHAIGADTRLRLLLAKLCNQHGAYFVSANATPGGLDKNVKMVVSASSLALVNVARDVFHTTSLTDFSNNMDANERLRACYPAPHCWSGFHLRAALHHGDGTVQGSPSTEATTSAADVEVSGSVVNDAFEVLIDARECQDGYGASSRAFFSSIPDADAKRAPWLSAEQTPILRETTGKGSLATAGPVRALWLLRSPVGQITTVVLMGVSRSTSPQHDSSREEEMVQRIQEKRMAQTHGHVGNKPRSAEAPMQHSVSPNVVDDVEVLDA